MSIGVGIGIGLKIRPVSRYNFHWARDCGRWHAVMTCNTIGFVLLLDKLMIWNWLLGHFEKCYVDNKHRSCDGDSGQLGISCWTEMFSKSRRRCQGGGLWMAPSAEILQLLQDPQDCRLAGQPVGHRLRQVMPYKSSPQVQYWHLPQFNHVCSRKSCQQSIISEQEWPDLSYATCVVDIEIGGQADRRTDRWTETTNSLIQPEMNLRPVGLVILLGYGKRQN